jgi:hypothetical protein
MRVPFNVLDHPQTLEAALTNGRLPDEVRPLSPSYEVEAVVVYTHLGQRGNEGETDTHLAVKWG